MMYSMYEYGHVHLLNLNVDGCSRQQYTVPAITRDHAPDRALLSNLIYRPPFAGRLHTSFSSSC